MEQSAVVLTGVLLTELCAGTCADRALPPPVRAASSPKDNGGKDKTDTKRDERKWEMLTDAYGRTYW